MKKSKFSIKMKMFVRVGNKILLLTNRRIIENDWIYSFENFEGVYLNPIFIAKTVTDTEVITTTGEVIKIENAKKIFSIISVNNFRDEASMISNREKISHLSGLVDDLRFVIKKKSVLISRSELIALLSILPDANFIVSNKIDVDLIRQKLNTIYQYKRLDGEDVQIVVKFDSIVYNDKDIPEGVELLVNGKKMFVKLSLGNFSSGGINVKTYYWDIFPNVVSDEIMECMNIMAAEINNLM